MATQANLRFTSKDEVRTVRDILQNKVVEKIQEQSEVSVLGRNLFILFV